MTEQDTSPSGNPIYRHAPPEREIEAPQDEGVYLEAIEAHLAEHVGEVGMVFHERVSDLIHLDVLHIPASEDRAFHLLVTSGVSDKPMNVPEQAEACARIELMIALPPEWLLNQEAFKDEANYWPVRWLKQIGRLPHVYDSWLGWGHSIPNGDPPQAIANTDFVGFVLIPPYWFPKDLFMLETSDGERIQFYLLMPVFAEEMRLKLNQGLEALEERWEKHNIDFVVNPARPNAARKRGWLSWRN